MLEWLAKIFVSPSLASKPQVDVWVNLTLEKILASMDSV